MNRSAPGWKVATDEKPEDLIEMARMEMEEALGAFRHELARVRTGRASTALLEGLHVNYYGARTPLRQLAGLAAPEPRLLVVTPYDKGSLHEIEKAIQTSDLGLTPINDGKIIRVPIPELTEQRRKELVRHVHKTAEESGSRRATIAVTPTTDSKKCTKTKSSTTTRCARPRPRCSSIPPSTSSESTKYWRPRKPR